MWIGVGRGRPCLPPRMRHSQAARNRPQRSRDISSTSAFLPDQKLMRRQTFRRCAVFPRRVRNFEMCGRSVEQRNHPHAEMEQTILRGEGWLRRDREPVCVACRSALVVDEQRRERRAVAARRAACSRRVIGRRGRDCEFCSACRNCCRRSATELSLDDELRCRRSTTSCPMAAVPEADRRRRRVHRAAGPAAAWTVGEGRLEHALQFGRLVAGQLAGRDFARMRSSIFDFRSPGEGRVPLA